MLQEFDLCLFDFCGCGNSAGDFVTLGIKEHLEIIMVINELIKKFGYEEFCLWGRSMGAVSSILALDALESSGKGDLVKCAVLDAPFTKARVMVTSFSF